MAVSPTLLLQPCAHQRDNHYKFAEAFSNDEIVDRRRPNFTSGKQKMPAPRRAAPGSMLLLLRKVNLDRGNTSFSEFLQLDGIHTMTDINLDMQNLATVRDKKQVRPHIAVCLLDLHP